jgi:hypothetical protein
VFSLELDGLVRQGKILPAEVKGYQDDFRAMGTTVRKYTEGDKEVEKTWGQRKLDELSARPKIVEFKEKAQGGEEDGEKKKPAGESFLVETEKVMRERKCTYAEAQEAVRNERPELGSSPRSRGTHGATTGSEPWTRFIPAIAGNTSWHSISTTRTCVFRSKLTTDSAAN